MAEMHLDFKNVVIETTKTWKLFFEVVPQQPLSEKIIPSLASLVGYTGTVHELDQKEAETLFQTDEAHKKRMKRAADRVADTPRMQNFMEMAGAFLRKRWESKEKTTHG